MGTHRLGAIPCLVPVCVYPSQPGLEAPVAELGAPATAVVQLSYLGDQERGDLARKNQVLAEARGCQGEWQSPPESLWPFLAPGTQHGTCQYVFVELGADALVWWEERGHSGPKEGHGVGDSESPPSGLAGQELPDRGWRALTCWGMAAHWHTQAGMCPKHTWSGPVLGEPSQPCMGKFPPFNPYRSLQSEARRRRVRRILAPWSLVTRSMRSGGCHTWFYSGPLYLLAV